MRDYDPTEYGICPECLSYPHKCGCPNKRTKPKIVGVCALCDEDIYAGDMIIDIDRSRYHDKCFLDKYNQKAD